MVKFDQIKMREVLLSMTVLLAAACGGGGGGGGALLLSPTQQANTATAASASLASSQSQLANTSISAAVSNLSELVSSNPLLTSNSAVTLAAAAAQNAVVSAATAQSAASTAAADLVAASNVIIVGVVSEGGRTICAAASSCTKAEISGLGFKAAETAKNAAEASLYAISATNQLKSLITSVAPSLNVSTATAAIALAESSALSAQVTANLTISNFSNAAREMGATITPISPSSGSIAGVAGTPTYSGNTQTIVTTFGNGQTSTAINTAIGSADTWAADHITKTTTYTFANGGTHSVVATVPGTTSGAASSISNATVSVSPLITTYGDGFSITTEDGSLIKPFTQATLVSNNISDSNSYVQSSTNSYDLRWGEKATPFVLSTTDDVSAQISSTTQKINFFGNVNGIYQPITFNQNFSSSGSLATNTSNFQGTWITQDVKAAWAEGWTGKNVKIGILDDFTANNISDFIKIPLSTGCSLTNVNATLVNTCSNSSNAYLQLTHGEQVSMIAGGSKSLFTGFATETGTWSDSVDLGTYSSSKNLTVNYSSPFYGVAKDASIYRSDFITYQSSTNGLFSVLQNWGVGTDSSSILYRSLQVLNLSLGGTSSNIVSNQSLYAAQLNYANASVVPDIVFVKAAGNTSCTINLNNCDPSNSVFYNSPQYKAKSIIVGALTQAGGSIASYSNKAGTYADIFLVADGRGIYDSTTGTYDMGTSFAAPRVAGYAAILRQKFANLNAEKSASILLDTARYDTLTCHPNCNPAIYGKGEASLSRALAPVGRLR